MLLDFKILKLCSLETIISWDVAKHCHLLEVKKAVGRKLWTRLGFHRDGPGAGQTWLQGALWGEFCMFPRVGE